MPRVLFVDVVRLCALLQMINGHTLDAVLALSERVGPGFERYRFARGLVSVAFLVVAGIAFFLTTLARFELRLSLELLFSFSMCVLLTSLLLPSLFRKHHTDSWSGCPFCKKAKALLDSKGAKYTALELDQMEDGQKYRAALAER